MHQGYFSGDAKISGNNSENQEAADIALILSDKQKLLSFNSPLRFIFSVWALQEGWDNPNIFTLTKLASSKDTSTHQQIGRGLRLCVNEAGKRITHNFMQGDDTSFYQINCLDVIVSGKEPLFIENLQKEINESSFSFNENTLSLEQLESLLDKDKANDIIYLLKRDKIIAYNEINENYNILVPLYEAIKESAEIKELLGDKFNDFLAHFVPNANKNKQVVDNNKPKELIKIKPHLAKDFKELWEAINKKAKIVYKNIQENALIDSIAKEFNALEIPKNHIIYTRKTFDAQNNIIITEDSTTLDTMSYQKAVQENIKSLLLDFAKGDKKEEKFKLPLHFVLRLYESLDKNNFYNNPSLAFNELNAIIKRQIHSELVQKIDYQFARNEFSPSYKNLIDSKGNVKQSIERHILGQVLERDTSPARNYLYEQIVRDSNIEKDISQENNESLEGAQIKVFAKLPKLSIPTPYKEYQPDFAYFLEDSQGKRIFFICESKGYNDKSEIPPDEAKKIEYAKVFFASLSKALKSENIRIEFKTRINKQELNEILREILQKD
ncbi:hypothetical protein [Helicobacter muridarum]|uniref:restriction endonuclease n=1 Tax=Helicobacter muridarum TaxID=216 RepID=UPI000A990167